MAEPHAEEELLDYEEDEVEAGDAGAAKADGQKKGYVGIHSTSFKDFLLKVRGASWRVEAYLGTIQRPRLVLWGGVEAVLAPSGQEPATPILSRPLPLSPAARAGQGHRALWLRAPQ
jgi:hypothetical protein